MRTGKLFTPILAALLATVAVAQDAAPPADARLDTQLTLNLTHVTVGDLCWVIEKRTGAVVNPADTETGDLLVHAVGEMTARDLLEALREALLLEWEHDGRASSPRYALRRTPDSIRQERAIAANAENIAWENVRRGVEYYTGLEAALARQGESSPSVSFQTALAKILMTLDESAVAALRAGRTVSVPLSALPPELRDQVGDPLRQRVESSQHAPNGEPLPPLGDPKTWRVDVKAQVAYGRAAAIDLEPVLHAAARSSSATIHGMPARTSVGKTENVRLPSALETADDALPVLPRALPISPRQRFERWEDMATWLTEALGIAIVADAYRTDDDRRTSYPRDGETAVQYIDRLARGGMSLWGLSGKTVTFRRMEWPTLRLVQPPESAARRWETHLAVDGRLSEEDVIEIGGLTTWQAFNLINAVPSLGLVNRLTWDFVRLWHELPPASRRAAQAGGVRIGDLPLVPRSIAAGIAEKHFGALPARVVARTLFTVVKEELNWTTTLDPGVARPLNPHFGIGRAQGYGRQRTSRRDDVIKSLMQAGGVTDEKDLPPSLRN